MISKLLYKLDIEYKKYKKLTNNCLKRKELHNALRKGNMELVSVLKSNYKLEIRFLRAETKKEIDIKYGRWLKKNRIKFLPISTLMKKVLDHLSLF